ncbi:MAG: acyl-CoA dehydrogenase family protein [Haloarculaceae archaeon]
MVSTALTDEQRMIVGLAEELAEDEMAEEAFEWEGRTPWPNLERLADRGLLGLAIPEAYGGGGMGPFEELLVIEAIGRVCPDTAWLLVLDSIAPVALARFGTDAAKSRYLPPVCAGETTMAIAISEPEAGSDVTAMNTWVEREGGEYYLTGEKTWVSAVPDSEAAVVWARFPDGDIGSVVIEFEADGVDVLTEYENMAGRIQTHFLMDEVHVPEEALLVTDRDDWTAQLRQLNWERVIIAMWTLAVGRCAIERALEYARTREQFGRAIGEFQGMRWKFADMVTRYEAGRSLVYRTASEAREAGEPPDRLASSVTRLFASENTERVVSEALQVFGANGYQRGHPLEYLYRFVRSRRIGHGTDEILKNGIADVLFDRGLWE